MFMGMAEKNRKIVTDHEYELRLLRAEETNFQNPKFPLAAPPEALPEPAPDEEWEILDHRYYS